MKRSLGGSETGEFLMGSVGRKKTQNKTWKGEPHARGRGAWEPDGARATQRENYLEEQCLVSINQPLPT